MDANLPNGLLARQTYKTPASDSLLIFCDGLKDGSDAHK